VLVNDGLQCSQKKLFCDGRQPCTACSTKRCPCERSKAKNSAGDVNGALRHPVQRGCASPFLLCKGDAEIFSRFEFPKPVRNEEEDNQVTSSTLALGLPTYESDLAEDPQPTMLDFDFDILDGIFNTEQIMIDAIDWTADRPGLTSEQDAFGVLRNEARLSSLASDILQCPPNAGRPEADCLNGMSTLQYLLSPAQAHRALTRYFESWHRICRIVHRPTFTVDTAPDVVLIAVLILGAMYLPDEEDRKKTLSVIDFVEDYIFSEEPFSLGMAEQTGMRVDDSPGFHFLQAAFLIVVTQYWTGSESSRRRVSRARFDCVIEVESRSSTAYCDVVTLIIDYRLLGNWDPSKWCTPQTIGKVKKHGSLGSAISGKQHSTGNIAGA
jgi:hypothetical protein